MSLDGSGAAVNCHQSESCHQSLASESTAVSLPSESCRKAKAKAKTSKGKAGLGSGSQGKAWPGKPNRAHAASPPEDDTAAVTKRTVFLKKVHDDFSAWGRIIGKGGANLKTIEEAAGASLKLQGSGLSPEIVITGGNDHKTAVGKTDELIKRLRNEYERWQEERSRMSFEQYAAAQQNKKDAKAKKHVTGTTKCDVMDDDLHRSACLARELTKKAKARKHDTFTAKEMDELQRQELLGDLLVRGGATVLMDSEELQFENTQQNFEEVHNFLG